MHPQPDDQTTADVDANVEVSDISARELAEALMEKWWRET